MKLESFALILLFSLVSKSLQGQYIPIVAEGKFWIHKNFSSDYEPAQSISGHAITLLGDTVINSLSYKKVYKYKLKGWHTCPFLPCFELYIPYQVESKTLIAFIREDTLEKKVYNLPASPPGFCDTTEHLIFDYALAVGDTLNSCIYDFIKASSITESPAGIVDSLGEVELYGKIRNTIFTTGFDNYTPDPAVVRIVIVEGVGLEFFGIIYNPLSALVDFCEDGMETCDLLTSTPTVRPNDEVAIFPNPTDGIVHITVEEETLKSVRIYSTLGVFIAEFLNTSEIEIRNLKEGIYFLELIMENNKRIVKKIVKVN